MCAPWHRRSGWITLSGHRRRVNPRGGHDLSTLAWVLVAVLYLVLLVSLGLTTLRNGRYLLFVVGIFLPVLWIVGGVMGPTHQVKLLGSP
jgi:hypothetical protein